MESRGNKFQVQRKCATTGKISSSVSFHQYFQMFHMNFKICFLHLVLLEMISFGKILKTASANFAIQFKSSWYKVFVHLLHDLLVDSLLITSHGTLIPVQLCYKYRNFGPNFRRSFRAGENFLRLKYTLFSKQMLIKMAV